MASPPVPDLRCRLLNDQPVRSGGKYVLYWMIANRRLVSNYSLDRAIEYSRQLKKPLVVLEALRCGYRWASDRLHAFVIQGMRHNRQVATDTRIAYYPYLEPHPGAGSGLLAELAQQAAVVVSDDFPCFFLPAMLRAAARRLECRFEVIDSNGLLPLRATPKVFARAYDFRRYLQKNLPPFLAQAPVLEPLNYFHEPAAEVPEAILDRWPAASLPADDALDESLGDLPIDHSVRRSEIAGGGAAAQSRLQSFLTDQLPDYGERRNDADDEAASGLSPYLHFGHLSTHQVFRAIAQREEWSEQNLSSKANGSSEGWWGMSATSESFLDELITWRELGYNMTSKRRDYDQYESLPSWAQATLAEHATDPREAVYALSEFEQAQTHDELWNAAQRQLVRVGRIHNYLRMLWGKNILKWTRTPQDALAVMIELNNKYALDGRNPNSYSGIFWVLGRYDRAWGPERPVFGKVRYMTSDNTRRKIPVKKYMQRFGPDSSPQQGTLFR